MRCPRCHGDIGLPGGSRTTAERDIEICGSCCSDEAMLEATGMDIGRMADWPIAERKTAAELQLDDGNESTLS